MTAAAKYHACLYSKDFGTFCQIIVHLGPNGLIPLSSGKGQNGLIPLSVGKGQNGLIPLSFGKGALLATPATGVRVGKLAHPRKSSSDIIHRVSILPCNIKIESNTSPLADSKFAKPILQFLNGKPADTPHIPMDNTPFLQSIYQNLYHVPYGQTTTYQKLATISGNPKAARAVGNAMRNNPLPIIYPCHRVIGKDGGLHGFAGKGEDFLQIKRVLLQIEKQGSEIIFK